MEMSLFEWKVIPVYLHDCLKDLITEASVRYQHYHHHLTDKCSFLVSTIEHEYIRIQHHKKVKAIKRLSSKCPSHSQTSVLQGSINPLLVDYHSVRLQLFGHRKCTVYSEDATLSHLDIPLRSH